MAEDERSESIRKLYFLYSRCSITRANLAAWLEDDDFVQSVFELIASGANIGNQEILNIMKPILAERTAHRKEGFKIRNARNGVNQISKALERGELVANSQTYEKFQRY